VLVRAAAACLALVALAAACSKGEAPPGGVRQVCESRQEWKRQIHRGCTDCIAKASTSECGNCSAKDYAGRCKDQAKAVRDEPTCEGTVKCVVLCPDDDCACIEGCYQGKDACQKLAAELDACTTRICDPSCR
jgi:hypothetical protein